MGIEGPYLAFEKGMRLVNINLINYLISLQAETYQEPTTNKTHGSSGPLKVSSADPDDNLVKAFLSVAQAYDKDRSLGEEMNSFTGHVDKYCVS